MYSKSMKQRNTPAIILRCLTIVLVVGLPKLGLAQEVSFQAAAPKVVSVGERFRLVYTVNAQGSDLVPGSLNDFRVLSGPNRSTSSSVQIINGKMEQSFQVSYSYVLQAQKEGQFTISPGSITVENETYESNPVAIEVVAGQNPSQTPNSPNSRATPNTPTQDLEISKEDLFLRLRVSKKEVRQGEPVVATLKLYTRISLANLGGFKAPSYNGFWSETLREAQNISFQRENVNGQVYNAATIQQHVLIPERTGTLTIDPAEITALVQVRVQNRRSRSLLDQFFGSTETVEKTLASAPVTLTVNPLPGNAPAGFSGAVGDIKLSASLEPETAKTNEPLTYTITYTGTGNLKLLSDPKPRFPSDFEVYDPKVSNNFSAGAKGYTGSKTYEYLLIPRHEGTFEIPALEFTAFDLEAGKYKSYTAGPFSVDVEKGEGEQLLTVDPGLRKEDVQLLGSDIQYIKTNDFALRAKDRPFFGSALFYLSYAVPLGVFSMGLLWLQRYRKRNSDLVYVKHKKAKKIAQSRLKRAKSLLDQGQRDPFYNEIVNAQWGYLSDKLNIPKGELNKEKVKSELAVHRVDDELVNDYIRFIDKCEFAQFAPGGVENELSEVYSEASAFIEKLEGEFG